MALTGSEDEKQVFEDITPEASLERLKNYGIQEICIKCGLQPIRIYANSETQTLKINIEDHAIDTTAAGDSFNAGYLAARLQGKLPLEAARNGAALAAEVVKHPGALISSSQMPKLL